MPYKYFMLKLLFLKIFTTVSDVYISYYFRANLTLNNWKLVLSKEFKFWRLYLYFIYT